MKEEITAPHLIGQALNIIKCTAAHRLMRVLPRSLVDKIKGILSKRHKKPTLTR